MSNSIQAKLLYQNALSQSRTCLDPGNKLTVGFVLLPFFYQQEIFVLHAQQAGWAQQPSYTWWQKKKKTPSII